MRPKIELYETPADRRIRQREEAKKRSDAFNAKFAARLTQATAALNAKRGRKLTPTELAAMLRERTGRPVTARRVTRWYRALSPPPFGGLTELAKILEVRAFWLAWGEGEEIPRRRAVYTNAEGQFSLVDNNGSTIATVIFSSGTEFTDRDAVVGKCYELLDIVSPDQPNLRVVK